MRSLKILTYVSTLFLIMISMIPLGCTNQNKIPEKVLVFGIDAASWKILDQMLEKNQLPHIAQLVEHGVRANLKTLSPTVSVMLWTTMATGMLPEHHGITSWLSEESDIAGQLSIRSSDRKVKAIWNLDLSRTILVSNWWASWPAESINGIVLSNRTHFAESLQSVSPPEYSKVTQEIQRITRPELENLLTSLSPEKNEIKLTDFAFSNLQRDIFYLDCTEQLLSKNPFGLVMVFVRGLDILGHEYLQDVLPCPNAPKLEPHQHGIYRAYARYVDQRIGRLQELLGPNAATVIASDHGMEPITELPPYSEGFRLDDFLVEIGIIEKSADGKTVSSVSWIRDNKKYPPGLVRGLAIPEENRFPKEKLDEKIAQTAELLKSIKVDDQPLFDEVMITDDLDETIRLKLNPKPRFQSTISFSNHNYPMNLFTSMMIHPRAGQHWNAPDGIFVASGPGIRSGIDIGDIRIQDIAPTILYLFNHAISKELDGSPAVNAFTEKFKSRYPLIQVDSYGPVHPVNPITHDNSIDEREKTELKQLGYIP